MIAELVLHSGKLIAVGDISWEGMPQHGDRLVAKGEPHFYKTRDGLRERRIDEVWYGRVRIVSRKFVYLHGKGYSAEMELLVEDLAASEAARGETDWSEPDPERATQAALDVAECIKQEGSLEKATVYYLNQAMRAARSSIRQYAPLMLEIDDILKRNGFDR